MFLHSGMCHFATVFEKSQFYWLINILLRRKWVLWGWHNMLRYSLSEVDSCCGGKYEEVGAEVPLLVLLLCPLPPQLFSSSGFSVEDLALRRSRGWGSVTFDEWILFWLTPLSSGCLILILCFFPHLSFTLSEHLSGLCSSLKTVVADLIGLCWTLALRCISYDHLEASSTQTSCED